MDTIEYLGLIVAPTGLTMDPKKTKVVHDWLVPKNVEDIQSFLGVAYFYRRFIANYSQTVVPMNPLTCKDTPFKWGSK